MDIVDKLKALMRALRIHLPYEEMANDANETITVALLEIEDLRQQLAKPAVEKELIEALRIANDKLATIQHLDGTNSRINELAVHLIKAIAAYDALQD
jgi:hypothetical protein